MCERCAQLEEEVAFWKNEAGALSDLEVLANLQRRYRLTRSQARLLEILGARRGRVIDGHRLLEFAGCEGESDALLRAHIRNIRAKLGPDAILTRHSIGFTIGPAGEAAIRSAGLAA